MISMGPEDPGKKFLSGWSPRNRCASLGKWVYLLDSASWNRSCFPACFGPIRGPSPAKNLEFACYIEHCGS